MNVHVFLLCSLISYAAAATGPMPFGPGGFNPLQDSFRPQNGLFPIPNLQGFFQQIMSMGMNNPMFRMMTEFLSMFIRFLQSFPPNASVRSILDNFMNLIPNAGPGASFSYNFGNNRPNNNNGPQFDSMPNIPNFGGRPADLLQKGYNGAQQAFEHGRNGVNDVYNLGQQGLNEVKQGFESFTNGVQDTAKELGKKGHDAVGKGYEAVKNGADNIRNSLPGEEIINSVTNPKNSDESSFVGRIKQGLNQGWNAVTGWFGSNDKSQ